MTYTLHHGDALDVLRGLPDASVDAVVTSPPYAMQRAKQYGGIPEAEYPAWTVAWLGALRHALKPRGSVLINIREHFSEGQISDYVHRTRLAVREAGWLERDELIWIKPDAPPTGPNDHPRRAWERILWFALDKRPSVFPLANGSPSDQIPAKGNIDFCGARLSRADTLAQRREGRQVKSGIARSPDWVRIAVRCNVDAVPHPGAYPVALAAWMLRHVCPPGGTVLDPFTGSGSTGVAALAEGMHFIGVEREAEYVEIARRRLDAASNPAQTALAI